MEDNQQTPTDSSFSHQYHSPFDINARNLKKISKQKRKPLNHKVDYAPLAVASHISARMNSISDNACHTDVKPPQSSLYRRGRNS